MLMDIPWINDGSNLPPRLLIYGNSWGLSELPKLPRTAGQVAWNLEQTLDKLVEAGFDGLQAGYEQAPAIVGRKLRFCASTRINLPQEAQPAIAAAAAHQADCLTVHVGWGMEDDRQMDELAEAVLLSSQREKLPVYLETHRATMLQDIWRTGRLLERYPQLRLNADLSHYYCGHEAGYRGFDTWLEYLKPLWPKIGFFHGRVSDGQCMQVDIGDGRGHAHAQNFFWMWREAMSHWLASAQPGDILPFAPELGPPSSGYSITIRRDDGEKVELSDRWKQSLVLGQLAKEAFAEARQGLGGGSNHP